MGRHLFILCIASQLIPAATLAQERMDDGLLAAIQAAPESRVMHVIIELEDQLDLPALDLSLRNIRADQRTRAYAVITQLKAHAERTQAEILAYLESRVGLDVRSYEPFWITNAISIEATPEILVRLSQRDDVARVGRADESAVISPLHRAPAAASLPGHAEPGLRLINAHKLWALGYSGKGSLVMNIDTGVDGNHPAMRSRWHGNYVPASQAWYDPVYGTTFPMEFRGSPSPGHGTYTMGIMVGMDPATLDTIGVAPGAEWIAAGDSLISIATQVKSLQWAMNPDDDPATTEDMPLVVNCSWTRGNPGCKETGLTDAIRALEAAGVAVIFAAGNGGPEPGSVRWPGRMRFSETVVFTVGYVNGDDPALLIGDSSARGPTTCSGAGNSIKPEVVAPGVDVRSSIHSHEYVSFEGTSAAVPHVSGAIALLKEAFPHRTGSYLKELLYETARDLGDPGEDNAYGAGIIDVYEAYVREKTTEVAEGDPLSFHLYQNYPNPFNPETSIKFSLHQRSYVHLGLFDLLGREVATLVAADHPPGVFDVTWDGTGFPSGLYFYRLIAGDFVGTKSMMLLR
jgi:bacillopeptidase F